MSASANQNESDEISAKALELHDREQDEAFAPAAALYGEIDDSPLSAENRVWPEELDDYSAAVGFNQEAGDWNPQVIENARQALLDANPDIEARIRAARSKQEAKKLEQLGIEEYCRQRYSAKYRKLSAIQEADKKTGRFSKTLDEFLRNTETPHGTIYQIQSLSDWKLHETHKLHDVQQLPTEGGTYTTKDGVMRKILHVILEPTRLLVLTE